jgi:cytochrome b
LWYLPQYVPRQVSLHGARLVSNHDTSSIASRVHAWDWPTRAFHWSLVTLIFCAWASFELAPRIGDVSLRWHRWNGYAILILVVFRVFWGFAGSSTSRFSAFIRWPWIALRYGLDTLSGKSRPFLGHNPLGSWMIVALLTAVAVQGTLGLFTEEHNYTSAGPLRRLLEDNTAERISKLHVQGFKVLLVLIALHVLANSLYQIIKNDPLITGMITGRKPVASYEDAAALVLASRLGMRACICLAAAITLVFGSVTVLGGRIF